jgi:hypothetical protein
MKQRIAAALMMITMISAGAAAHAQTTTTAPVKFTDDLFAGTEKFAKNAVSATEVTMDPQTLGLVDGKDKDKARSTKLSVVRTYTYEKPGMYDMAEVEAYRNKLNTGDWHCSVRTRDLKTGLSSDICNRTRTDGLFESAIMTVEPKQLTFIHTIKTRPSSSYGWNGGGWQNESELNEFRAMDPALGIEMRAEMATMQAEMKAQMQGQMPADMAALRAGLSGLSPSVHVDLHGLTQDLKGLRLTPPAPPAPPSMLGVPPVPPAPPALP